MVEEGGRPTPDPEEFDLLSAQLRRQLTLMFSRNVADDVLFVRVMVEEYQHAAGLAKQGRLAETRRALAALRDDISPPSGAELSLVLEVAALPVWSLLLWKEGDASRADAALSAALQACACLAEDWNHDYLTLKQLHLAMNIARVQGSTGDGKSAEALLAMLEAAVFGDRSAWPFAGGDRLSIPLTGLEREVALGELKRVRRRLRAVAI